MKSNSRCLIIFFSIFIFSFICLTPTKYAFAESGDYLTQDQAEKIALKWAEKNHEYHVSIKETIPIYKSLDNISAYSVSFSNGGQDAGYIIINADKREQTFREFSLKGKDIYTNIFNKNNFHNELNFNNKVLYENGVFDYSAEIIKNKEKAYLSTDGRIYSKDKFASEIIKNTVHKSNINALDESDSYLDGIINNNDSVFNGLTLESEKKLSGISIIQSQTDNGLYVYPFVMDDLRNGTNLGNCALTAATNIIGYYYRGRGMNSLIIPPSNTFDYMQETYDRLVQLSDFNEYGSSGLSDITSTDAIKDLAEERGYSPSTSKYWLNLWSDFKRDLDNNWPVYTSIKGYNPVENKKMSHAMVSVGYRIYTNGSKFLNVIDGHMDSLDRFINFSDSRFDYVKGVVVKINA